MILKNRVTELADITLSPKPAKNVFLYMNGVSLSYVALKRRFIARLRSSVILFGILNNINKKKKLRY